MTRTVYALLVGIDAYENPVPALNGCINDITHVETFLSNRVVADDDTLELRKLTDAKATRPNIIKAFREHLAQAKGDDVALFYYSGHGAQEKTPLEFAYLEPDGLNETLVCYDSRSTGGWDLADKELAQLISEVAADGAHVAIFLDCCHSGSGTRLADTVGVRRALTDNRIRPLDQYIVSPAQAAAHDAAAQARAAESHSNWLRLPQGRHVVLSACRADETAKELAMDGEKRGVFSYFLLDALQSNSPDLSYHDLSKRISARVHLEVGRQTPQVEATEVGDLQQPFLGGAIAAGEPYFTLRFDAAKQWWAIDGGTVHGIATPAGDETTYLAIFPLDTPNTQLDDLSKAIGQASVTVVEPSLSLVMQEMFDNHTLQRTMTYKAIVTATPLPPLLVVFEGEDAGVQALRQALSTAGPDSNLSFLVREGDLAEARYRVVAESNSYHIRRLGDVNPLEVKTDNADLLIKRLEHIARWQKIAELSNKGSRLAPDAVRMDILRKTGGGWEPVQGSDVELSYRPKNDGWEQPQFKIRLTNTSDRALHCTLLDLPETFGVFPILQGAQAFLQPGEVVWALGGEPMFAEVKDKYWTKGISKFHDTLKLIVSTDELDATLLAQKDLEVLLRSTTRAIPKQVHNNTLNRLMNRVHTRHLSSKPTKEAFSDWTSAEVSFTTIRPQELVAVSADKDAPLVSGVTLKGHPHLQANAQLISVGEAGRDLGSLLYPAALRDCGDQIAPYSFTASRSTEPGLNVLELTDVADYNVVTADDPLVLDVAASLAEDEYLLPLGFDGEFFLPLGRVQRNGTSTEIRIERLPAPTSGGKRDFKGSIKILFQKIVGQKLGLDDPYPVLAVADVDKKGNVTYLLTPAQVQQRVAAANKILLYVHGLFGDTKGMAGSSEVPGYAGEIHALGDDYDLILTFDYESINTRVQDTARVLKQRLEGVGLGAGHGKTLHVVAHSLGGLVSRWLVEREGGADIVQQLTTVGTPHIGTPWPTVQDWATTLLAIGLNSLSVVAWPVKALAWLVKSIELVDVTPDQFASGSDFLKDLNASAAPGIPYILLAGNTSVIPQAATEDAQGSSRIKRLLQQLKHQGLSLVFFNQPNDIAVSVNSALGVPTGRAQVPALTEAACDHVSFFTSEAGLQALGKR